MAKNAFASAAPGDMLKQEFLVEYGLSQNQLAKAIGISPNRIAEIVNNRRRITADTALRLSLYFGNSPEFWMNLQTHYDLKMARQNLDAKDIRRIKAQRAMSSQEPERTAEVVRRALPELAKLDRYESRAAARPDRAIQEIIRNRMMK